MNTYTNNTQSILERLQEIMKGGIKAVIWTDAFQFIVMVIGLVSLLAVGVAQNGGIIETLFNPSPFVRHTFFNTVAYGIFSYSFAYSTYQPNLQRIFSVKSVNHAKSASYSVRFKYIQKSMDENHM
ncbi:Sodium-coupled monocarboxylate transporter 1 [Armadillidium vulgare]|nr:Sodium-coupled monocarboxylate transporter 1 [Armadillidium vulgare]